MKSIKEILSNKILAFILISAVSIIGIFYIYQTRKIKELKEEITVIKAAPVKKEETKPITKPVVTQPQPKQIENNTVVKDQKIVISGYDSNLFQSARAYVLSRFQIKDGERNILHKEEIAPELLQKIESNPEAISYIDVRKSDIMLNIKSQTEADVKVFLLLDLKTKLSDPSYLKEKLLDLKYKKVNGIWIATDEKISELQQIGE